MKISVVIPNRNDTAMLAVTVRSILEELKGVGGEIVIVDNSDQDIWHILNTPNVSPLPLNYVKDGVVKLIRQDFPSIYSARQTAIENATGEYVYNVDSHMLIGKNQLVDIVAFMDDRPEKCGFGFAPIGWVGAPQYLARHDIRTDKTGIFGSWGRQYFKPTKICWNFGSCICDRKWYLEQHGGLDFFSEGQVSWGGGEFYSAIKSCLLGYENWAIPCNPQYHIGPFSKQVQALGNKYRLYGNSGNGRQGIGILSAFYALGGDSAKTEAAKANDGMKMQYGITAESNWAEAKKIAEKAYSENMSRFKISFNEFIEKSDWEQTWDEWEPEEEYNRFRGRNLNN